MDLSLILTIAGLLLTLLIPIVGYFYKQKKAYHSYYSVVWKNSHKLKTGEMLGERPYYEYYFKRDIDKYLREAIDSGKNILIKGPPLSGKTRAVYHYLKTSTKPMDVLMPRAVSMPSFIFPRHLGLRKRKVIFIDDLQYYVERQENYQMLFKTAKMKDIPIIAVCHSGMEFKKVKNKMADQSMDIDTIFGNNIFEAGRITQDEGKLITNLAGLDWNKVKFNGTIGSIFMRLFEMEKKI